MISGGIFLKCLSLNNFSNKEKIDVSHKAMMAARNPTASVFMVINGSVKDGEPQFPTFVRSQAEALRDAGCQVLVSVIDDRTSFQGILRNIRRLKSEIAAAKPDIVHVQYGSVTAAIARLAGGPVPLVVSFCGDDLLGTPQPGLAWRVRESCARAIGIWAARKAAAIIVKSDNLYQALPATLRGRGIVLPNGVDTNWFIPMDQDQCRAKLGWPKESKVVLFNASRNEDQVCKNPALARETVSLLTRAFPNVSLHTISNVSSAEVRLTMNAADCLLVTSLHEGSPNIVKEAMACNLPVVSVPCGDVVERLQMTSPGGIAPYNAKALAEKIDEVLKTGHRSNGRERLIRQGLMAQDVAESLIQLYRNIRENRLRDAATNFAPSRCI